MELLSLTATSPLNRDPESYPVRKDVYLVLTNREIIEALVMHHESGCAFALIDTTHVKRREGASSLPVSHSASFRILESCSGAAATAHRKWMNVEPQQILRPLSLHSSWLLLLAEVIGNLDLS